MNALAQPPFLPDEGREGVEIGHLIDRSDAGDFAEALFLFPHSITILDDAPTQLTETDRAAQSLGTAPRREVAEPSFLHAHPARVFDSHHDQPDSPEAK